ncbi:hypothetical protein [Halomonas mongoliensis]|uniref:hypothetical protein n=1 Tax=Halomonas mongoliensis TaxID=321265 RepID=UPI00286A8C6F|nr:hypothetical protein [Halomonas mongoliensis]
MEAVVEKANMARAYRRVVANKGAPGADGMTVHQLADHLKECWPTLRERLLAGEYHPSPIRAIEIPKPKGGTRQLGIPTVTDRLIQQALLQVLMASLSDFLESSLGLTVNRDKSTVDRPSNWGYLGYKLTLAKASLQPLMQRVRKILKREYPTSYRRADIGLAGLGQLHLSR